MTQTELQPLPTSEAEAPSHQCAGLCGRQVTRRAAIGAGVVVGAAALAACGSSSTPATSSSTSATSSAAPSTSSSASSSSAAATSSATSESSAATESSSATSAASTSAAAPTGTEIAKVADIPDGGSLIVTSGDESIALAKQTDGTVVAHSAVCTHQGSIVKAEGATLKCFTHGSVFDAFTGAVTQSPAQSPLEAITVAVSGDAVYLQA